MRREFQRQSAKMNQRKATIAFWQRSLEATLRQPLSKRNELQKVLAEAVRNTASMPVEKEKE